jgi:hydrogenase maturation protease
MTDGARAGGTVVLGAGSPLMGDDGLGVEVVAGLAERFVEEPGLHFLDGGIWGMQLLPQIEDAERLLVVDVIRGGAEPGTLIRMERDEIPRYLRSKISPHQIDLGEVFAVAELRGTFPAVAVALGIEPERVEAYEPISEVVRATVPQLVEAIVEQLDQWGHELVPAPACAGRRTRHPDPRAPALLVREATRA